MSWPLLLHVVAVRRFNSPAFRRLLLSLMLRVSGGESRHDIVATGRQSPVTVCGCLAAGLAGDTGPSDVSAPARSYRLTRPWSLPRVWLGSLPNVGDLMGQQALVVDSGRALSMHPGARAWAASAACSSFRTKSSRVIHNGEVPRFNGEAEIG